VNTIKIYLEETYWEEVDWINLAQDTDRQAAGSCGSDNVYLVSMKYLEFLG
jgi:hypothetical protein